MTVKQIEGTNARFAGGKEDSMKRVLFVVLALTFAVAAMGATDAQGWINLGVAATKAGDHAAARDNYLKAAEVGKGKLRCTALRCVIYSITKQWGDGLIPIGDKAAEALEAEFAEDGDGRMARATWWGRRQFELLKVGNAKDSLQYGEKSIAARQDLPMFANNLAVCYCDLAERTVGSGSKAWAQKAIDLLAKYRVEGKLAETKARAEGLLARAK